MRNAVGGKETPTANEILESAERLLDKVLRTDCETRASALDLLTVDALMTHALHVANERDPRRPKDFAEQAMRRIRRAVTQLRLSGPAGSTEALAATALAPPIAPGRCLQLQLTR